MSKVIFVNVPESKKKGIQTDRPFLSNHLMLMYTIVIVVTASSVIGFGFAYMGYTSGHYSEAYGLCKANVLAYERVGAYPSVDEVTAALKSCEGVTT